MDLVRVMIYVVFLATMDAAVIETLKSRKSWVRIDKLFYCERGFHWCVIFLGVFAPFVIMIFGKLKMLLFYFVLSTGGVESVLYRILALV